MPFSTDDLNALLASLPKTSGNYGIVQNLLNNPTLLASSIGQNQLANVVGTAQQDVTAAQNPTYTYTDPSGVTRTTTDKTQIPAGASNVNNSASALSSSPNASTVSNLAQQLSAAPASGPSPTSVGGPIDETGGLSGFNWSPLQAGVGRGLGSPGLTSASNLFGSGLSPRSGAYITPLDNNSGDPNNSTTTLPPYASGSDPNTPITNPPGTYPGGRVGGVLSQIFGGQNFNLGNVLPAALGIAGGLYSYLGTDSAFNKAGNLVNNAEVGAGNQVNNAATAAGNGVMGATDTGNGLLNSLLTNFQGSTNPYTTTGAIGANDLASSLEPGGQLNPGQSMTPDQIMQNDPGYQFRLGQGDEAAKAQLAAEGLGGSGEAVKQLDQFNQDFASNEYGNVFNRQQQNMQNLFQRLAGTSQLGEGATGQNLAAAADLGAPQASNLISGATTQGMFNTQGSQYQGNANVAGAGAQAGATIDANQAKQGMIQQILNSLMSLFRNQSSQAPTGGGSSSGIGSLLSAFGL